MEKKVDNLDQLHESYHHGFEAGQKKVLMSKETKDKFEKLDKELKLKASKTELRWLFGLQVSVLIVVFGWLAAQIHNIELQTTDTRETVISIDTKQGGVVEDVREVKDDLDFLRNEIDFKAN